MDNKKIKYCPQCSKRVKGHPNKIFCNKKCRYKYHNIHNPRGIFKHLREKISDDFDPDFVDQKIDEIEDTFHPFDGVSLGQD